MTVWKNCEHEQVMDFELMPQCDVKIDGRDIVVSYRGDRGPIVYTGREIGDGHYDLQSASHGKATLHRFPNSYILEGFWRDGAERGMWRITLTRDQNKN